MLTSAMRSALMVNDETPTSYSPDWTPGMMLPNGAGTHSTVRPSLAATAANSSTSQPTAVFPPVSRYSLGGEVVATPTTSFPSAPRSWGPMAAATASNSSTSQPTAVFPSVSRYSLGG